MRTWVKICGLSTPETVDAAVEAGADAVGFVLAEGSPRTVDAATVRELAARVPEHVEAVGVFRGQGVERVIELARASGLTTVQLHGDESPADVAAAHAARLRVVRAVDVATYAAEPEEARVAFREDLLLIDAVTPGAGAVFDGQPLLDAPPHREWLLAGGLDPENVAARVAELRPAGVDVSSGVESSRGVKSVALIREFVAAARAGDTA
ncbi:phosphoribosylanthranilate isomerase [Frigoribacterium sp. CFBP 13707]|uniref:phosphoribosylanthranilate isomerase n=1 Tax=Frigoribacterium sp. CFBP 13707 TaxID=2775313 RepID=UPI001782A2C1|nr:phosphoribosylanthranilate isomerase [Frigoribacterium sp. CFBP 13707]MBD8728902.1 phosphoribosylanthranilate isomerase [Frigoribacterium sp. CFBP 13707]